MAPLKVLLVDDEGDLLYTVAERLTLRGYEVDAVTDGAVAVSHAQMQQHDVAVVDVKMPGMNGIEVLAALKKHNADLPVILLTGHGSEEDGQEGMRQGAFAYLIKPTNLRELMESMEEAVGARER
jgi:DNA-binding response OmpR family regulator